MSDEQQDHSHDDDGYEEHAHHGDYVRIWAILSCLLVVSVAGPFFGHPIVTLITAFGIAVVKAYMVAKNFMHVTVAPRYVAYLMATALMFMLLFFAGAAPDVMKLQGTGWEKPAWVAANAEATAHHGEHGEAAHE